MTNGRAGSCTLASLRADEPLAGTASTVRGYVLLEHGGPWGAKALDETAVPDGVGGETTLASWLAEPLLAAELTPLLVRRHGARPGVPAEPYAGLVLFADPRGGPAALGVQTRLRDLTDTRSWDVEGLVEQIASGLVPDGWEPMPTQYLVCTHGRRDVCCAELGRPLAAVLQGLAPDQTWEVSHLGGHRLAANVLVVPEGAVYGRLVPDDALDVVAAHAEGRLMVDRLRGRAGLAAPVQVAEVALREALPTSRADAVRLQDVETQEVGGATRTTSRWCVGEASWRVVVDTAPSDEPPRPASCGAPDTAAPPRHTVVEVTDTAAAGRGATGWDEAHAASDGPSAPHPIVVQELGSLPAGAALDVACGTGRHSLWLAQNGWDVTGLDFSRAGLDVAQAAADARGLDVSWVLGDARVWSPAAPVDLVLAAFVHVPHVLGRARAWLRPGGRLVVVGHARRNLTDGVGGPSDPRLLHDPHELREAAAAAGLEVLRCEEVERRTADGTVVDAVLVARRPS